MNYPADIVGREFGNVFMPTRIAAYPVLDFFRDQQRPPGEDWYLAELLHHILNGNVQSSPESWFGQNIITLSSSFYGCDPDTLDKDIYEEECKQLEEDITDGREPNNFIKFIQRHLSKRNIHRTLPTLAAMKSFLSIATMIGAKLNPKLPPEQIIHNITLSFLRDGKINNGERLSSNRSTTNYGEPELSPDLFAGQLQEMQQMQQAQQAFPLDSVATERIPPPRSLTPELPGSPERQRPFFQRLQGAVADAAGSAADFVSNMGMGMGERPLPPPRLREGGGRKKRRRNTRNTRKKSIKQKRSTKRKKYTRKRSIKQKRYTRKRNTGRKKSRIHKRRVKDENLE